jgi:hypothetical protein
MLVLQKISAAHQEKVVAVLEDLLKRANEGELTSFAYIAEEMERGDPLMGVVGRYREEPTRLLGELSVMKMKLSKYAARRRGDFSQTAM